MTRSSPFHEVLPICNTPPATRAFRVAWLPLAWAVGAALLVAAPLVFSSGYAISLLSQMGIMIVLCLSYNMLYGQTGLLSFGHAVYSGLGALFAVHILRNINADQFAFPVVLLPLVAGVGAGIVGVVLGFFSTRRAGTTFAMITLGIAELLHACSLTFPQFFGGETGISANRVTGDPFLGITFGPARQVYYLIAGWCLICVTAMYALTRTPLGLLAKAVRDNPERVQFVGYNPRTVRFLMLILSAVFAGVSGGLTALTFEIASADNMSAVRSGAILFATIIGGAGYFLGPAIGAMVYVLAAVALSDISPAWQLYLGIFFVLLVALAPGGLAQIAHSAARSLRHGNARLALFRVVPVLLSVGLLLSTAILAIELLYRRQQAMNSDGIITLLGLRFDVNGPAAWALLVVLLTVSIFLTKKASGIGNSERHEAAGVRSGKISA